MTLTVTTALACTELHCRVLSFKKGGPRLYKSINNNGDFWILYREKHRWFNELHVKYSSWYSIVVQRMSLSKYDRNMVLLNLLFCSNLELALSEQNERNEVTHHNFMNAGKSIKMWKKVTKWCVYYCLIVCFASF